MPRATLQIDRPTTRPLRSFYKARNTGVCAPRRPSRRTHNRLLVALDDAGRPPSAPGNARGVWIA